MKQTYLIAPPCDGTIEGFPGALTVLKNYLDYKLGKNLSHILDLEAEPISQVKEQLSKYMPQEAIFGITATTATYKNALQVARVVKEINPNATVIIGGHHVKSRTKQEQIILKKHSEIIDYVCLGDGEKTLEALMQGKTGSEVPNVAFLLDEQICYSQQEDLPIEEWEEVPFSLYKTKSKPGKFDEGVSYVSSRGCNYKCTFCSVGRDAIRQKSEDRMILDLKEIVLREGVKNVAFENNFFSQNVRATYQLAQRLIQEREKNPDFAFNWTCQTRVEYLSSSGLSLDEFVSTLYKSGAKKIYLGIENFDPRLLLEMSKVGNPVEMSSLSSEKLEKRLKQFRVKYVAKAFENADVILSHPIELEVLFMLGRPSEDALTEKVNVESLYQLGKTAKDKCRTIHVCPSLSVVYPGTLDAERLLRETDPSWNTIFEDFTSWENENTPERRNLIDFVRENFAHGGGGIPWGLLDYDALKEREFRIDPKKQSRIENYLKKIRELEQDQGASITIRRFVDDIQRSQ